MAPEAFGFGLLRSVASTWRWMLRCLRAVLAVSGFSPVTDFSLATDFWAAFDFVRLLVGMMVSFQGTTHVVAKGWPRFVAPAEMPGIHQS
jgi:hypothetical protein